MSVGVEALDSDHQALIGLLNELGDAVEIGAESSAVAEMLDALIAETEQHFRREEAIMAREEYPEAEHHRLIHEALIAEFREFRESYRGGMEIGPEITEFVRNWLVSHIMESDMHLGGYLEGRRRAD